MMENNNECNIQKDVKTKKSNKTPIIIACIVAVVVLLLGTMLIFREPIVEMLSGKEETTERTTKEKNAEEKDVEKTMNVTDSGTCGENLTWKYDESTGLLVISGTGAMDDYYTGFDPEKYIEYCNYPWRNYAYDIKEVVIKNGVTAIGEYAFYGCNGITSVTIPDSVTKIGDLAFCACTSLTSITIPDAVDEIGTGAFIYCSSLISITVDSNNKYYSSDKYGVLFNKDKTTLIQYPIGSTRTSYTIPNSVTTVGDYAFYYCTSLTSVTIPDSVTTIDEGAFLDCTNLKNITISDSVTIIADGAFNMCESLTNVYYSGTETQWKGISIFVYNDDLTNATIHYNQ